MDTDSAREDRLQQIVRRSHVLMHVLRTLRALDLPEGLVFSGAVYQTVLNHLGARPIAYGIKDYDIGYFDADLSREAEDAVIRRVAAAFRPPFRDMVEVRNQARVHLWFESKFGEPYPPVTHTAQCLERFVSPMFAVGVRLEVDDRLTVVAPFGLEDLFARRLRRNPNRSSPHFPLVAASVRARWPEVEMVA